MYETRGLVRPRRTPGNTRLYSEADLERLRTVAQLTGELGLNLAGVERVLELEDEVMRLQARLARMERELDQRLRAVHRQYRRELVLYEPAKLHRRQRSPTPTDPSSRRCSSACNRGRSFSRAWTSHEWGGVVVTRPHESPCVASDGNSA